MHGDRGVRHQRPRGGRPDQQAYPRLGERPGGHREADVHRRVDHVLVPLGDLVVGQRCLVTWAVRGDPVILDEQPPVEDLPERPPDALDVGGVHGAVGVVQIAPVGHPLGHPGEVGDVAQHRLAAAGVELGDAEVLDVALAGEAQLLFHGEFDGQAVTVPTGAARDVEAAHRAEAGEEVLEHARLDVMGARPAVGGRGTLVEDPLRAVGGRVQGALEDLQVLPALEHVAFEGGQVDLGRQRREHRRGLGVPGWPGGWGMPGELGGRGVLGGLVRLGGSGRHGQISVGFGLQRRDDTPRYPAFAGARWHRGTTLLASRDAGVAARTDHSSRAVPDLLGARALFSRRLRGDLRSALAAGLAPSPARWTPS